ncbi:MAG: hypothetical protein M1814_003924 [Vezdaea aestivalis]|nr:MAG: hypothetical protein M1814_003924 [Vezdaea aestivalis]
MPKNLKLDSSTENQQISIGKIVVTAQQSRFHVDAIDAPDSKDIDVKDLNITVGTREIINNAHLRIQSGTRMVLAGRNGTGKSSLLKALANGMIPGVPLNLRVLLLGQTKIESIGTEAILEKGISAPLTVLEHVIKSDAKVEKLRQEAETLSSALEQLTDPITIVKRLRAVKLGRTLDDLEALKLSASRRSGARGLKARKAVNDMEASLEAKQSSLDQASKLTDEGVDEGEIKEAVDLLEDIRLTLEAMDASSSPARARTVLLGLGFPAEALDHPFTSLSGGWRMRCELASVLTLKTDVLCLDEPTNFLALDGITWLQSYITSNLLDTTVIVVSHDRDFADAIADELLVIRTIPAKTLEYFKGNISTYENERQKHIRYMTKMKEAEAKKINHMESSIASNIAAAKRTGDDKKLKQAGSRKKKLAERTGLEVGKTGGRFKLNRDRAGFNNTLRAEIEIPELDPPVHLSLPASPVPLKNPGPLVSLESVSFAFPKSSCPIITNISLTIQPGQRLAIVGLNGSGKSTLINILTGSLIPSSGTITRHPRARIAYYTQHAITDLENIGATSPDSTALSHFRDSTRGNFAEPQLNEGEARAILVNLGLRGKLVTDVPLVALSGGQRVRLALAKCVWDSPHLLVLDEVSTHLDAESIVALIEAFETWEGSIVLVSHDRFLVRGLVEGERPGDWEEDDEKGRDAREAGVVFYLRKASLRQIEGGMDRYEQLMSRATRKIT